MTFAHPQALWLLALGIPVVVLHFYRGRIRNLLVPSLQLWDALAIDDDRLSALRQLRHHLSLALTLAALVLLAIAAGDPAVRGLTPEPRRVVVVIDTDPAMRAAGRLDEAVSKARTLLGGLARGDSAVLYDRSGLLAPATRDKRALSDALRALPRDLPLLDRAGLLETARRDAAGGTLHVFSPLPGEGVTPVGSPLPNRSLSAPAFALLPSGDGPAALRIRVTATNHSDAPDDAEITVRDRGETAGRTRLSLGPRESREATWTLDPARAAAGALLEFSFPAPDAWPGDDLATLVVPPHAPPAVALLSGADPDPHLLAALDVLARTGQIALFRAKDEASARAGAAVVVYDGVEPAAGGEGGRLVVAPKGGGVESPAIVDWSRDAPFHRRLDYRSVRLRRARIVDGPPLILSDRGPIASWDSRMGAAWIRFGFSFAVEDGDFALRPAFPLFLRDAILWLAHDGLRAFPERVAAGATLSNAKPLAVGRGTARITEVAAGSGRSGTAAIDGASLSWPVLRTALIQVEIEGRAEWIAANDPSAGSVDLTAVPGGPGPAFPDPVPWWRDLPVPTLAAALALLLLLAEWRIYQTLG